MSAAKPAQKPFGALGTAFAMSPGKDLPVLTLAIALAFLVGITLGLLGGGGSILTVPILRYVAGLEGHRAVALSLLVVGVTSLAALIPHALRGRVRFRTGAVFGLAAMAGAFGAGHFAGAIPASVLLLAFAGVMFAAAFAMLRRRPAAGGGPAHELPILKTLLQGLAVGAVSGLVGAGGGFMIVPALVLLGGLPIEAAVGTSLLVIAMSSLSGFAGFAGHTAIDWTLAAWITGSAVAGSVVGSLLVRYVTPARLRGAFGWFVVSMAFFVLSQEAPPLLGREPSAALSLLVALTGTLAAFALKRRRGSRGNSEKEPISTPPGSNGKALTEEIV